MISCLYGCCSKGLQAFRPSVSIQQCHEETNLKFMSFKCDQNFTSEAKKQEVETLWRGEGGGRREELRPVGVGMFLYVGSFGLSFQMRSSVSTPIPVTQLQTHRQQLEEVKCCCSLSVCSAPGITQYKTSEPLPDSHRAGDESLGT